MSNGKKGLPIWAWFGIGCAGLLVIVMVILVVGGLFVANKVKDVAGDFEDNPEMTAARIFVKMNPEFEEIESNEEDGTITVREKKSGKVFIANVDDLKEGRFVITDEDGEVVMETEGGNEDGQFSIRTGDGEMTFGSGADSGERPDWIPVPPAAKVNGQYAMTSDTGAQGTLQIVSELSAEEILAFYRAEMERDGYNVQTSSYDGDGQSVNILQGFHDDAKRTLIVNVTTEGDEVNVGLTYREGE